MTVIQEAVIPQRIWRGYADPGLPVGMYMAQDTVLGDMTGGDALIRFIFRQAGNPVSGRFWNIEQLEVMRASSSVVPGFLQAVNWEVPSPTGLINWEWLLQIETGSGNFTGVLDRSVGPPLPLFLGSPDAVQALEAQVNIGFNNSDGVTILARIQGYIWEPRSILAEGGLRRPVDSLYGR